eukprot:gnl/MRDRNA2_/MRDRNA2_20387_c0_seq1.p2 gnl/MRDRNA2_/MRDRNA2_20387_c0~~gnl/MRDRNA2_/MRDRNA2_20387_c0_seq1.p2  ORF type:complete len:101 (+),score=14.52 gnl/MRDRNA2_/MRDRNA2_20387_c0_seq1:71-373(+)
MAAPPERRVNWQPQTTHGLRWKRATAPVPEPDENKPWVLNVRRNCEELLQFEASSGDTVAAIKDRIAEITGCAPEDQRLCSWLPSRGFEKPAILRSSRST